MKSGIPIDNEYLDNIYADINVTFVLCIHMILYNCILINNFNLS